MCQSESSLRRLFVAMLASSSMCCSERSRSSAALARLLDSARVAFKAYVTNEFASKHSIRVHATKIAPFVDCRRSCRRVSSAQGEEGVGLPELR
jgi:hypothetical protein